VEAAGPAPLSRRIHFGLVLVLLAGLAVQFYFAGRGAFGASTYSAHKDIGGIIHLFSLLFLIVTVALPATRSRVDILLAAALFVDVTLQAAIGSLDHPEVGAFHPVNALVVVGIAFMLLKRDRTALAAGA
jgi:hypothetical protein